MPSPEAQALSGWTVKPTAVSIAETGNGSTLVRTFTRSVAPCRWIPAVGLESIETKQKSFGAVAPGPNVTVWACQPLGFWRESRPLAGWIVTTKPLLVSRSAQPKPTTRFERMKASGWRGIAAPVVTDSFVRFLCCAFALNEETAR